VDALDAGWLGGRRGRAGAGVHEPRERAPGDGRAIPRHDAGGGQRGEGKAVSTVEKTRPASRQEASRATGDEEFILLGIPDVHGAIRGKALRPAAFQSALRHGTVMTDLLLALDPTDTPISDYTT